MYTILRIAGDPSTWTLTQPLDPAALDGLGEPLAVQVTHPLAGTLLLSPGAAAGIALTEMPVDWVPGHIQLPEPVLYLPSPSGPTDATPGYTLPPSTDQAQLTSDITAAMLGGGTLQVPIIGGVLVLSGPALSFAVLCPAVTGGGPAPSTAT